MTAHIELGQGFLDELDASNRVCRDPPQHRFQRQQLVGRAFAIDQQIAETVTQAAAVIIARRQRKAGQLLDHVQRCDRIKTIEKAGLIADHGVSVGGCVLTALAGCCQGEGESDGTGRLQDEIMHAESNSPEPGLLLSPA